MLTRNFTFCQEPDFGFWGLRANWMPNADPFDGEGCAHDMLEHFATQVGPLEGECEAIGAHLYVRLENGWALNPKIGPLDSAKRMGGLLSSCLVDGVRDNLRWPPVIATKPLEGSSEEKLQAALDEAFRLARIEFAHDPDYLEGLEAPDIRAGLEAWMRRGYRQAVRRYAAHDTYDIAHRLFKEVREKLDLLIENFLKDGDDVKVTLDLRKMNVHVRVNGESVTEYLH